MRDGRWWRRAGALPVVVDIAAVSGGLDGDDDSDAAIVPCGAFVVICGEGGMMAGLIFVLIRFYFVGDTLLSSFSTWLFLL